MEGIEIHGMQGVELTDNFINVKGTGGAKKKKNDEGESGNDKLAFNATILGELNTLNCRLGKAPSTPCEAGPSTRQMQDITEGDVSSLDKAVGIHEHPENSRVFEEIIRGERYVEEECPMCEMASKERGKGPSRAQNVEENPCVTLCTVVEAHVDVGESQLSPKEIQNRGAPVWPSETQGREPHFGPSET